MPILDLDEFLDGTLDEVIAAPEFVAFPNGRYQLEIVSATPKIKQPEGKDPYVRVNVVYGMVAPIELEDSDAVAPAEGSLTSEGFNLTAQGEPYFKAFIERIFGDVAKGTTKTELIEALPEVVIEATIRARGEFADISQHVAVA